MVIVEIDELVRDAFEQAVAIGRELEPTLAAKAVTAAAEVVK